MSLQICQTWHKKTSDWILAKGISSMALPTHQLLYYMRAQCSCRTHWQVVHLQPERQQQQHSRSSMVEWFILNKPHRDMRVWRPTWPMGVRRWGSLPWPRQRVWGIIAKLSKFELCGCQTDTSESEAFTRLTLTATLPHYTFSFFLFTLPLPQYTFLVTPLYTCVLTTVYLAGHLSSTSVCRHILQSSRLSNVYTELWSTHESSTRHGWQRHSCGSFSWRRNTTFFIRRWNCE